MRIQQECIRKDMVHMLVFASTSFLIAGLQASFQCHGVCHIYYGMLEHALLALPMHIGMVLQYIQHGIALCILMCICHCIIFILYQEVVCITWFGKAHLHHAMAYMPSACIHKAITLFLLLAMCKILLIQSANYSFLFLDYHGELE